MKKIIKALLLSAVILGTAVGCQETGSSEPISYSTSDVRTSENPFNTLLSNSELDNILIILLYNLP